MPCERCRLLPQRLPIDLPQDMKRVIDLARAAVDSGALEEVTHFADGRPLFRDMDFLDLPSDGPWPDIVCHYFRCTGCGGQFEFSANTYHGSGGEWTRSTGPR